jgi:hypothetical protein
MSDKSLSIDVNFNFYSDSYGKDPDTHSPTLKRFHRILWSKPLPNGEIFKLINTKKGSYLTFNSKYGEINLTSDSISNSYRSKKSLLNITNKMDKEVEEFRKIGSTIGGYIIFPGKKIDGKMTINGARGFNKKIADRFNLTLECIRLHYLAKSNPLESVLNQNSEFFKLFKNYSGYVNFFFLQDLVSPDYESINYFLPTAQVFKSSPLPKNEQEYVQYMQRSVSFTLKRNERIKQWAVQERSIANI